MKRSKSMRAVFMKPDGSTHAQDCKVAPNSRHTIHVDDIPGLEATEFSTRLQSTNDVSLMAEREMYWNLRGAWTDVIEHMRELDREHFVLACVDAKLRVTAVHTVSVGTLTASVVHPREVFKTAILVNASGIVLLHNHPSGDPAPSDEDRRITERLEEAGRLLGIPVIDHLVIGHDDGFYSFADADALEGSLTGYRGMIIREKA